MNKTKKTSMKQIMGNPRFLLGLILGGGVGYLGAILCFFVYYLFQQEIEIIPFLADLFWGIFLIILWFWFIKDIKKNQGLNLDKQK